MRQAIRVNHGRAKRLGPKIFDKPTRDKLRTLLDDAKQRAKTDVVRRRIAAVRGAFDECEASVSKGK